MSALLFKTVKDMTICFDDLERISKSLDIVDVLGLVNFLKEERNCKIIIILNDEALSDKTDDFIKYFEKVIDEKILFEPSPTECASIAISGNTNVDRWVRKYSEQLKIRNIRVIKKLRSFAKKLENALKTHDPNVLELSIKSSVIIGWCTYEKDIAPSLEYLKTRVERSFYGAPKQKKDLTPEENNWFKIFSEYGFTGFDELDYLLEEGIKRGFLDTETLKSFGEKADEHAEIQKRRFAWQSMMFEFHNRASRNTRAFVRNLVDAAIQASSALKLGEIDWTMRLLISLGSSRQAKKVVQKYLLAHDRSDQKLNIRVKTQ